MFIGFDVIMVRNKLTGSFFQKRENLISKFKKKYLPCCELCVFSSYSAALIVLITLRLISVLSNPEVLTEIQ